jgi:hypothetical protein
MLVVALATGLVQGLSAIGAAAADPTAQAQKGPEAAAAPASVPAPADFKLSIAFYGVGKEPITTAELVVRNGTAYLFASESPEEIVICDPAASRLEFLDLDRRIQAEVMLKVLEEKQAVLRRAIANVIKRREEEGGRANRLEAEMSRDLIEPNLAAAFEPAARHLRLTNPRVTVDATGEPEPDAARLALIDAVLTALIRLESVRDPKAIPPFIRLDALHALTAGHHLRPAELTFLYRLAGPPRKHRWTYRLVETLTAREIEALNRVIRLRERTPYVPFDRYESRPAKDKP